MNGLPTRVTWGLALAAVCIMTAPAAAQSTIEYIPNFSINKMSADGTAAAGLEYGGVSEIMRWTAADGLVRLGQSSVAILGRGSGTVDISEDGQRVSGSIATLDSLYVTQGRWTKGIGWEETMPPVPPNGHSIDEAYGSCWGLSGDGETVVGLYWVTEGGAHANTWTQAGGLVDLGSQEPGRSSRANDVNSDGSVVVGWSASPVWGSWQPTVWEDGVMTVLFNDPASNSVEGVNSDGTIIVGSRYDEVTQINPGVVWTRTEIGWDENVIGYLPGTSPAGRGAPQAVSDDGSIIVGTNKYTTGVYRGFVWTLETGMMRADDYIESLGILLPSPFDIRSISDVTPDGSKICGYGIDGDPYNGGVWTSFIVTIDQRVSATPDLPVAADLTLEPVFPNPFNPSTNMALVMDRDGVVQLDVYDLRGSKVRTIHDGFLTEGRHILKWNGQDDAGNTVASGVYLARANGANGASVTRRLTLLK